MSTRCTTHFTDNGKTAEAIVYRHSDGYPEGAGADLKRFLQECAALSDPRFDDPSYLAAKYVVFLADIFNNHYVYGKGADGHYERNASKLDFLSVGIVRRDPGDIEYRYTIDCSKRDTNGLPVLRCESVIRDYGNDYKKAPTTTYRRVDLSAVSAA